jgi:predicted CXXCH cytochrome family protein
MQVTGSHNIRFWNQYWGFLPLLWLSFCAAYGQSLASVSDDPAALITTSGPIDSSGVKPLWGGPASYTLTETINSPTSIPLHHFDLDCGYCHASGDFDDGDIIVTSTLKSDVDINNSCTLSGCHTYDPILNHPVDMYPTGSFPAEMPLDSSGRMTCLTCHDQQSAIETNPSNDRLLDVPSGIEFCSSCHLERLGTSKEQAHWQFSSKAHLGSIHPEPSIENTMQISGILDTESQTCLSCHEDISATIAGVMSTPENSGLAQLSNHPVGMSYSSVASRYPSQYNTLSGNDRHIRLFDGKMGCGSCHSLYSTLEKNLVQDNSGDRLCFECHNK